MDCSPPGSSVHGILQARMLEGVAIPFSSAKVWNEWSEWSEVAQSCPILGDPMDCTVHGILQARVLAWVTFPFSRGSSQLRDWTQVSRTASRFFTSWVTGKPKNTEVGSLSLLQRILPTQESNRCLPHCTQILYQLSYQWSQYCYKWH